MKRPLFANLTRDELDELLDTLKRSLSDEHPIYGRPASFGWDEFELPHLVGDVEDARRAAALRERITR
jgi:hypothetical protein